MYFSSKTAALLLPAALIAPAVLAAPQQTTSTASTTAPTAAVVQTTISGTPTIVQVAIPTTASSGTGTEPSAATTSTAAPAPEFKTNLETSTDFPVCNETSPRYGPFCNPSNSSEVYVGMTYYVTWDPTFFSPNSNITVLVNNANSSKTQLWSSPPTENNVSWTTITFQKEWLQGYPFQNLTLLASMYDTTTASQAKIFDGPTIQLSNQKAVHWAPPPHSKLPDKPGLVIGLPVSLGFVLLVVCGLWLGMRHKRQIGIKNIMGRSRKGYKVGGKSARRGRMGDNKYGVIRLEERELTLEESMNRYTDEAPSGRQGQNGGRGHLREVSLGSLVSEEGERERDRAKHNRFAPSAFKIEGKNMRSWGER